MRDRGLAAQRVLTCSAGRAETAAPPVMGVRNCRDQDAGSDKKQTRRHPDPDIRGRAPPKPPTRRQFAATDHAPTNAWQSGRPERLQSRAWGSATAGIRMPAQTRSKLAGTLIPAFADALRPSLQLVAMSLLRTRPCRSGFSRDPKCVGSRLKPLPSDHGAGRAHARSERVRVGRDQGAGEFASCLSRPPDTGRHGPPRSPRIHPERRI